MNDLLDKYGEIPLPPYIENSEEESFHEKSYQTEYATNPGAVAAPTAGLHLSKSLISNLKKKRRSNLADNFARGLWNIQTN